MTIRAYDPAQRAVVPLDVPPVVQMYVCGITPYDSTHLGHAATYLTYDLLVRRLEDLGHEVRMVRNITDVDDSILPKARELGVPYLELADAEMARFRSDMDALDMRPPVSEPRATEAIDEIIELVGRLLESGYAYLTHGTAYFDVSKFPTSGELSHYSPDNMLRLARARGAPRLDAAPLPVGLRVVRLRDRRGECVAQPAPRRGAATRRSRPAPVRTAGARRARRRPRRSPRARSARRPRERGAVGRCR